MDSMDKSREEKMIRINAFTEKCNKQKLKYEVHETDLICDSMTENKSKYLHITMMDTTVM